MANTIAGVNPAQIAQESLPYLVETFAPLNAFVTDFSTDVASRGESVTTRFPTVPTAQDLTSGYSSTDVSMTAKTVTLNTFYGFVYGFLDDERSKSAINLMDLFIGPAIEAVQKKVFGDIWNLVNDTNFPAAAATELASTAANFDRDDMADLAAQLTANGVPKLGRSALLNESYYAALAKDLNAADTAGQTETLTEHRVPRIHGFDTYEVSSGIADGNSVNVTGLVTHRASLLFAGRLVDSEGAAEAGVQVENVTVPGIGIPVQFRKWYDPDSGQLKCSMGLLYGVTFGLSNYGIKIVSS